MTHSFKRWLPLAAVLALAVLAYVAWDKLHKQGPGEGFASGNGRI